METYGYKSLEKKAKLPREGVLNFWRAPIDTSKTENNQPIHYLKGGERSDFLVELIGQYLPCDLKILEIGCNVGRNMAHLFKAGYTNLSGIEINKKAIDLMKKVYPDMYKRSHIIELPIEEIIREIHSNAYDLIYTMAVLEHIHYDSDFVLSEIGRVASKYIITIEDEKTDWSERHFPRNYKDIFEKGVWKQVFEVNCKELKILDDRFWVRVFMRGDKCLNV